MPTLSAPTIRNGQIATAGTNATNADMFSVDVINKVFTYDVGSTPAMTILLNRGRVKPAVESTVKHFEDQILPEWDTTSTSYGSGVTAIVPTNPTFHRAGDLIAVPRTGEVIRVQNVAGSTLTVSRAWAGSATAMNSGEPLVNLGAAEMEGDVAPPAKLTVPVTRTNFTQILKTPVEITRTNAKSEYWTGDERARLRRKEGEKHARKIEQIMFHGRKKEDTTTGLYPIRSAGGLDEYITTNTLTVSGALTEADFDDFAGEVFRYCVEPGRKRKVLYASRELLATINSWGRAKLQTNSSASATYGINIATYISSFGQLDIINHPLLEQAYAGYGYIVDMDGVWVRPFHTTELQMDIQDPGLDGYKDQFLTEISFTFAQEATFGKISGVSF